jgi:hypothetical protein
MEGGGKFFPEYLLIILRMRYILGKGWPSKIPVMKASLKKDQYFLEVNYEDKQQSSNSLYGGFFDDERFSFRSNTIIYGFAKECR